MEWAPILAFLGGLSVSIITLFGNWITKRHESKEAYKRSVIEHAFKEYELRTKLLLDFSKEGKDVTLYPWDMHVVSYGIIMKYLDKKKIRPSDVERMLDEVEEIAQVYKKRNAKRMRHL